MTALQLTNLHFSYPAVPVLQGIDLHLQEGERIGLIGPNGAGKTTLFHCISGVIAPTTGSVSLFDEVVKPGQFHPKVGLVFQYPSDQIFSPSVYDDIAFGPLNMGQSPQEVAQRVEQVMKETDITHLKDRAPHHLSGGQKRMVAIAGIQAMQPQLIIYDEPSANLDMRSRRQLINHIRTSTETVIVSSHDLELILEVADRVLLLDDGQLIADGHPKTIMADEGLMLAHGLETPHSLRPHAHTPTAMPHTH